MQPSQGGDHHDPSAAAFHAGAPTAGRRTGDGGPGPGGHAHRLLVHRPTTTPTTASGGSGGTSSIPAAAFSDTTGLTADTVTVGNVSTLYAGLFKGALVGTQAYAAYVNSTGGLNGRKVLVDSYDDGYQGAPNKQETEQVAQKDFAAVGGFSLQDSYGETVLAADPSVPNVTVSLDQAAGDLPNSFSPDPAAIGWPTGGLLYFKSKYPSDVKHTRHRSWPTSRPPSPSGGARRPPWRRWATTSSTTSSSTSPPRTSPSTCSP